MAKRRCISIDVMESDEFFTLDEKPKLLYVYLMLHSDDEGVVINMNTTLRIGGFDKNHLKSLVDSGFVLCVDDVYIIAHWNVHNRISPSKKTDSVYKKQLSQLVVTEKNVYELKKCEQNVGTVSDRFLLDIMKHQQKSSTI